MKDWEVVGIVTSLLLLLVVVLFILKVGAG